MFFDGLGYDIRKYEKYIRNMSGKENNKNGDDRLEKYQQQSKMTSDCDNRIYLAGITIIL